jgi:hypothetical protein
MIATMKRREFITLVGGAAAWPVAARAQGRAMPVVGMLFGGSPQADAFLLRSCAAGPKDAGTSSASSLGRESIWTVRLTAWGPTAILHVVLLSSVESGT